MIADGLNKSPDNQIKRMLQSWVDDGVVPGVAVAVAIDGVIVLEHYAGKTSAGAGTPVDTRTLYSIASISKVFTATLIMRLVERGDVAIDEAVRRFLPTFTGEGKRDITLRDLLSHTSGLPKENPAESSLWSSEATFAETIASTLNIPLAFPTGTRVGYSNVGYWLLGGVIETVSGGSFADVMRSEVFTPAGLTETFIDPPESEYPRIARRYGRAKIMNAPYGRRLASPSAGIFATARDLVKFAAHFFPTRQDENSRLLSPASVVLMSSDQTRGLPGGIEGIQEWPLCPWGLGWEIKGAKRPHWTGDLTSGRTFCHIGQGGTLLWADPVSRISLAILANRDISTGWATDPARWARLTDLVATTLR